ncbi:MAG: Trans-aconitate 2-methyltransferase [Chlamydiales bacterium]|nr:Trans-aconitate 2-methyltransferase [Chlamydiales bacterium]
MRKYFLALMICCAPLVASPLYFQNSEPQGRWAREALSDYPIERDASILDFGSKDGKITAALAARVPDGGVTGVDTSGEMVHFASKMFPFYNLHFVHVEDPEFSDFVSIQNYDLVTAFSVLHLHPNPSIVVEALRAHMAPGASFILSIPLEGEPAFFCAAKEEMEKRGWEFDPPTTQVVKMRSEEEVKHILKHAGFKIVSLEIHEGPNVFSSKKAFVDWCEAACSLNWDYPEEGRREFFEAVVERYLTLSPESIDEEGFVTLMTKHLNVRAQPE